MALVMSPMSTAAMNAVDVTKSGLASGILSMWRMVGGTFGVAVLGAIFQAETGSAIGGSPTAVRRRPRHLADDRRRRHARRALGSRPSPSAAACAGSTNAATPMAEAAAAEAVGTGGEVAVEPARLR